MVSPTLESTRADLASVERLLEHFEQLERQFQQVRDGLTHSHRLATLGTIASIVAHEYNNILTPVISYAQLALAKPEDRELLTKAVEKSLAGAERAAKISSSLLGFARDADHENRANVRQTIEEAIGCLAREPKKDGIDLILESPEDLWAAIAPLNLQQVLLNLLLNARQAMRRRGGRLHIQASSDEGIVSITVADTGPGIPEDIADRIFEPFVTLRSNDGDAAGTNGSSKGTGLGLYICRDLIRAAGGEIQVKSRDNPSISANDADTNGRATSGGSGAEFVITLPQAPAVVEST